MQCIKFNLLETNQHLCKSSVYNRGVHTLDFVQKHTLSKINLLKYILKMHLMLSKQFLKRSINMMIIFISRLKIMMILKSYLTKVSTIKGFY